MHNTREPAGESGQLLYLVAVAGVFINIFIIVIIVIVIIFIIVLVVVVVFLSSFFFHHHRAPRGENARYRVVDTLLDVTIFHASSQTACTGKQRRDATVAAADRVDGPARLVVDHVVGIGCGGSCGSGGGGGIAERPTLAASVAVTSRAALPGVCGVKHGEETTAA